MKKRFICRDCGKSFEVDVIKKEEAEKEHKKIIPIDCPYCGSYNIEPGKKYY